MNMIQQKKLIKQRILDIERHNDINKAKGFIKINLLNILLPMPYLNNLKYPETKRAFMLLCMDLLPSVVLLGRYNNPPYKS